MFGTDSEIIEECCKSTFFLYYITKTLFISPNYNINIVADCLPIISDTKQFENCPGLHFDGDLTKKETFAKLAFEMLNLMYYFTVGKDEVRSWTIKKNMKAP